MEAAACDVEAAVTSTDLKPDAVTTTVQNFKKCDFYFFIFYFF